LKDSQYNERYYYLDVTF